MSLRCRQSGASLVELIMFIVVIGAGLVGILGVLNTTTQGSSDPLIQKQALAIAEAYMEEVLAMPFTYCDPDNPNAATAQSASVGVGPTFCSAGPPDIELIGAEAGETRGSGTTPYDNVNDYNSLAVGVPASIDGTPIAGLGAYQVAVSVVGEDLVATTDLVDAAASQRVTVTVTGPGNTTVRLDGYRTRYAPNALP
jgi:MSHA pilin protein MshD